MTDDCDEAVEKHERSLHPCFLQIDEKTEYHDSDSNKGKHISFCPGFLFIQAYSDTANGYDGRNCNRKQLWHCIGYLPVNSDLYRNRIR